MGNVIGVTDRSGPDGETTDLRVALIGTGSIGTKAHIPAWTAVARADIVAIADPDADARETAKSQLAAQGQNTVTVYRSAEDLFDSEQIDIADITVRPTGPKAALIRSALQGGCHVTCQKPFLHNYHEASELVEFAEDRNRILSVNHQARFAPAFARAKEYIANGSVGNLRTIQLASDFDFAGEKRWFNFSSHSFDLVRFFAPDEPSRILAWRKQQAEGDRYLLGVWLDFPDDLAAEIWDEMASSTTRRWRFRIMGSDGTVEGNEAYFESMEPPRLVYTPAGKTADREDRFEESYLPDAFTAYFEAFVSAIRGEEEPPTTGRDNLRTIRLAFAAGKSFRTGGWVRPDALDPGSLSI